MDDPGKELVDAQSALFRLYLKIRGGAEGERVVVKKPANRGGGIL
jgi:hypothetical protein